MVEDRLLERGFADLVAQSHGVDFSVVLSRTIASVRDDPVQLRNIIYELARIKLQRACMLKSPRMSALDIRRVMLVFDAAIEQIESSSTQTEKLRKLEHQAQALIENLDSGADAPRATFDTAAAVLDDARAVLVYDDRPSAPPAFVRRLPQQEPATNTWPRAMLLLQSGILVALAALLYMNLAGPFGRSAAQGTPATEAASPPSRLAAKPELRLASSEVRKTASAAPDQLDLSPGPAALPLPSVYGVYAISDGELSELEALPGRVPDPRVAMAATNNKPNRIVLPDGRVSFIVYLRGFAANAPDRVAVRVFAAIKRAMTFDAAGKVNTTSQNDAWAIRNIAYDFRIAPVEANSEMLLMKPEKSDLVLAPGRYALVLNGQGYDFSVAGSVTDPAQCLERTVGANGTFYSECRSP